MEDNKIPVAAIVGPTASGKTSLAAALAKAFDGEVVSADSMQIYRTLSILTAKPTKEEMRGVPHHLIDFLEPDASFSVADYVTAAAGTIREIRQRGKIPFIAGGTGLYIDALLDHIRFDEIKSDPVLRETLRREAEESGGEALLARLEAVDPATAKTLHPNNLNRIIRALEVYTLTGVPMSKHQENSRLLPSPYDACKIGLDFRDRAALYARIDTRVDRMMAQGLLAEAREIHAQSDRLKTAAQAIGYREFAAYFEGRCSLDAAVEAVKRNSRRYAKRQLTWFRRDARIFWLYHEDYKDFSQIYQAAAEQIKRYFHL